MTEMLATLRNQFLPTFGPPPVVLEPEAGGLQEFLPEPVVALVRQLVSAHYLKFIEPVFAMRSQELFNEFLIKNLADFLASMHVIDSLVSSVATKETAELWTRKSADWVESHLTTVLRERRSDDAVEELLFSTSTFVSATAEAEKIGNLPDESPHLHEDRVLLTRFHAGTAMHLFGVSVLLEMDAANTDAFIIDNALAIAREGALSAYAAVSTALKLRIEDSADEGQLLEPENLALANVQ